MINAPDAPPVRQRWFFTDQPFITEPTVFNNRIWDSDDSRDLDLGEVYGASRDFNGMWRVPGLLGGHMCGTPEQMMTGATWPYVGPPTEYGPDHIPLCCPRAVVAQVEAGARPASRVTAGYLYRSRVRSGARPASTITIILPTRPTAGARPASTIEIIPPPDHAPEGGARPASTIEIIPPPDHAPEGGARPASTIAQTYVAFAQVEGGARPASTVAQSGCGGAIDLFFNEQFPALIRVNPGGWWARLEPLTPGTTYHIWNPNPIPSAFGYNIGIWRGAACGSLFPVFGNVISPSCIEFTPSVDEQHWISAETDHDIDPPNNYKYAPGTC